MWFDNIDSLHGMAISFGFLAFCMGSWYAYLRIEDYLNNRSITKSQEGSQE